MISRLTKVQLVVFAIVTLLGGAFVGGKYAQVDRFFVDRTFPVTAQFSDSGGIFTNAEVTYRGIGVGRVGKVSFTDDGVAVRLDIEKSAPRIPSDVLAVVANKSAIGEQYVDLQPRTADGPFLASGSTIAQRDTRIPVDTTTLLTNVNDLVSSVDTKNLQTVVGELGTAFEGTGRDLGRILDTSSSFIAEASENIDVTRQLIRDSDQVLQTQVDKGSQIASFSKDLRLLSDTLVDSDPDLRRLLNQGGSSAKEVRTVVDENSKDLSAILRNLRTANKPLADNVNGLQTVFVLYPYLLAGSYSVVQPTGDAGGNYEARFGAVLTGDPGPHVCTTQSEDPDQPGYRQRELPDDLEDAPFRSQLGCTLPKDDGGLPRSQQFSQLNRSAAQSVPTDANRKESLTWLLLGPSA